MVRKLKQQARLSDLWKDRKQSTVAGGSIMAVVGIGIILKIIFAATPIISPTGVYTNVTYPTAPVGFNDMSWTVTPQTDPSPDGYFYSNQFGFYGSQPAYFGIQTVSSTTHTKDALFSIWGALDAKSPSGVAGPFTEGAPGYNAQITYNWQANHTYKMYITPLLGGPVNQTWWQATIQDLTTSGSLPVVVGQIEVPTTWGKLTNYTSAFSEHYSGPLTTCADMHHSVVDFNNFSANGGTILPTNVQSALNATVTCPNSLFSATSTGGHQEMGVGSQPTFINIPPTASITYPPANSYVTQPASFTLNASASETDVTKPPYTYTVTNPSVGSHSYAADAYDNIGAQGFSPQLVVAVHPSLVSTPSGLAASLLAPNGTVGYQMLLKWGASTDPAKDLITYQVSRNGVLLGTTTKTSFNDTNLQANATYNYSITAKNPAGVSSAPATITEQPKCVLLVCWL